MQTGTRDTLKNIRRKIGLANPGWPAGFVFGWVDGMLDAMDGYGREQESAQPTEMHGMGYRSAFLRYSDKRNG